jgi:hypothetical protein
MQSHISIATTLATLLDSQFGIGKVRFGLSAIIDMIPGFGDTIDAILSFYIVWIAIQLKIPISVILKMIYNIAVNFFLGLIPFIGELTYIIRKANMKNVVLLKEYISPQVQEAH